MMDAFLTRRSILTNAPLSGLALAASDVGFAPTGSTASADMAGGHIGALDVRLFGAIGDGQFHPLSEQAPTVAAARARFASARSLSDSLDGAAIQAAIDRAAQLGAALQLRWPVHIPAGRYRLSQSLRLPGNVLLIGDGRSVSIIDNQNTPLDAPLIVNANPDVVTMAIHDLSLHGGTHGVRIEASQYVDGYEFLRVDFQMQTDKNLECNRLLQIGSFTECTFAKAPYGVYVEGWTTNVASFNNCRFEDHTRSALHLNGAECVNIFGGRFESGRGVRGDEATIDLRSAAAVNFVGVYFEGTPPVLLRDRQSRNGVTFTGCHFTGSANPGGKPAPYCFESDGIVHFGANDWGTHAIGPARATVSGNNDGLAEAGRRYVLRTPTDWDIRSEEVRLEPRGSHVVAVLSPVSGGTPGGITGRIELTCLTRQEDGDSEVITAAYRFTATVANDAPIAVALTPEGGAGLIRLALAAPSGSKVALLARMADGRAGQLRWRVEAQALGDSGGARIKVDLA